MGSLYPMSIAALTTGVLVNHEMGHYYSALTRGGNPDVPYVIPLGIGSIGLTRVRNLPKLSKRAKRYIIASGPVTGILTAVALVPVVIVFGGKALLLTLACITAIEAYNGTFGSDGRKWKMEREQYGMA